MERTIAWVGRPQEVFRRRQGTRYGDEEHHSNWGLVLHQRYDAMCKTNDVGRPLPSAFLYSNPTILYGLRKVRNIDSKERKIIILK